MESDHPKLSLVKPGSFNKLEHQTLQVGGILENIFKILSDRRVIEVNPILWQIILNLFILTFRPSKTAHAYKKIWIKETNESHSYILLKPIGKAKKQNGK